MVLIARTSADRAVGVAGYELTHNVPEKLKDSLPSPEELEKKNSI